VIRGRSATVRGEVDSPIFAGRRRGVVPVAGVGALGIVSAI
jgi:hypothetical protein